MYLKDSDGNRSFTVTMSIVAFIVVMLKVLIGGGSLSIGSFSISSGTIGSDEILALLGPTLGVYSFRRYTDRKYEAQEAGNQMAAGAE